MAKSIEEIKSEILTELHIGIDDTEGSFISSLVGAISTQIAMLEETIDSVKVQQLPEFADTETLVLLGRKCGLYPLAATASQISIIFPEFDPQYAVGDPIRFVDSPWAYTVQSHDSGSHQYTLECVDTGEKSNDIPSSWYTSVQIEPRAGDDRKIIARVTEIQRYGRDPEDISQFRLRVTAAHNVAPLAANEHWVRTILTESGHGITCVRIDTPTLLYPWFPSTATIYVAGPNFNNVNQRQLAVCSNFLNEVAPIGTLLNVRSTLKLEHKDDPQGLSYTFQIPQNLVSQAWQDSARKITVKLIQDYITRRVLETPPRQKITIVPDELVGALRTDKTIGPYVVSVAITYQGTKYTNRLVSFAINHIPWITPQQITFVDQNGGRIREYLLEPEW